MTRRRSPLSMLALAILATLAWTGAANARKTTIKLATMAPKGSVFHTVLTEMGDQWKQLSGGQVQVRIFAGGVAGDDADVVRKMRLGTVSGGLLTSNGVSAIDPAMNCLMIPMAIDSYDELDYVVGQMRATLDTIYADKGFVVLAWLDAGFIRFFTTSPVNTVDGLRRAKLYASAAHPATVDLWRKAGFTPIAIPATEISMALQTGLINALPAPPQAALLMQWNNAARNMVDVRWMPLVGALVVEKKAWEGIDADTRDKLAKAATAAAVKLRADARPADQSSIDAMKKRGLNVVAIDAATVASWRKEVEATYPQMRDKYAPKELFDEALRHRDAFRKAGGAPAGAGD